MWQAKHKPAEMLAVVAGQLIQGVFRAGHLSLIALGFFALGQFVPLPAPPGQLGRLDEPFGVGNTALASPHAGWLAEGRERLARALSALGDPAVEPQVEPVAMPEPAISLPVPASVTRLSDYLSNRYRVSNGVVEGLVVTAQTVGKEIGVDPLLIVSVIAVESSFNPLSESRFGAQGLMQVIPKYHMDKLGEDAHKLALFEPATNIRVGALVLKEYMRRTGSVEAALQNYAGASSDEELAYARKVLAVRDRLGQFMKG